MAASTDELGAAESQPLLWENTEFHRSESRSQIIGDVIRRQRTNTMTSLVSSYEVIREHVDKEKFIYLLLTSFFFYLGFMAAFAPRSSLSMDFRWLHRSALTESEVYRIYLNSLQENNLSSAHMHNYSSHASRPGDDEALQYTLEQLKEMRYHPKLEKYYPWTNTPIDTQLKLFKAGKLKFEATIVEEPLGDYNKVSSEHGCFMKGFHGYSANGNVTTQFVFVNYGRLEDYKFLLSNNIQIEDKIHVVREGKIFRGLKLKNAELYGASGVITYTDPFDDGHITNSNGFTSYPNGPARHLSSIQRGSVGYFSDYPGDPTSCGFASKYRWSEHSSPAGKIPNIPSLPLSAKEVAPLLKELSGKGVTFDSIGDIDGFDYSTGPSSNSVKVQLVNNQQYDITEITNVIVDIPGIFSEGTIIVGSHRDHWTLGGTGSSSSDSTIMLEIARGISDLLKKGWKPLRPIKLISWDGSEQGLLGVSDYAEDHRAVLTRNSLAYINLDTTITGTKFECNSNPLLHKVIKSASRATFLHNAETSTLIAKWSEHKNDIVGALKGLSDSVVFQSHLGIPSANCAFVNDKVSDAVYPYHSNYDSSKWMETFLDSNYVLHNIMAKFVGLVVLELSEKEIIPFQTHTYFKEIRKSFQEEYKKINEGFPHDKDLSEVLEQVQQILTNLTDSSSVQFDNQNNSLYKLTLQEFPLWQCYRRLGIYNGLLRVNSKLKQFDKLFLWDRGLKGREWMKHSIYAPDKFSGYDGEFLPGIHNAVIERDRDELIQSLTILYIQLNNVSLLLR